MRSLALASTLLLVLALPAAAAFDQVGFDHATRTILCDCGCHPQSIHDCACGRAAQMRGDVAKLIEQGLSGEAVVERYVAEHGDQIRIAPTATGFNLVAWLGPLVGLVLASVGMLFVLRRWTVRRPADAAPVTPEPAPATPTASDDPYRARLRRELEDW